LRWSAPAASPKAIPEAQRHLGRSGGRSPFIDAQACGRFRGPAAKRVTSVRDHHAARVSHHFASCRAREPPRLHRSEKPCGHGHSFNPATDRKACMHAGRQAQICGPCRQRYGINRGSQKAAQRARRSIGGHKAGLPARNVSHSGAREQLAAGAEKARVGKGAPFGTSGFWTAAEAIGSKTDILLLFSRPPPFFFLVCGSGQWINENRRMFRNAQTASEKIGNGAWRFKRGQIHT